MTAGLEADASSAAAAATSSGSAAGAVVDGGVGTVAVVWAKSRSIGKSRNTGARWGVRPAATAATTSEPIASVLFTVVDTLVIGASTGTWSNSCSEPAPQRPSGARPPSTTSGEPRNQAPVTALTPLVTPGPAVSTATPGRRVSLAIPSAAKVAVAS